MRYLLVSFIIYILIQIVIGMMLIIRHERKEWNDGVCSKCGEKWKHFDTDSQGGRMYRCDNWHYYYISYNVDKYR